MDEFYIYIYLDPRKPGSYQYAGNGFKVTFDHEPIYVGKGSGYRKWVHLKRCTNKRLKGKIKYIKKKCSRNPIIKLVKNLDEERAFKLEEELIVAIGRIDFGEGPLTNVSDGGDGLRNAGPEMREASRKRMNALHDDPEFRKANSERAKKRWKDPEYKKKMLKALARGRKKSWKDPKYREKMKKARKKLDNDLEHKKMMSNKMKKRWKDPEYKKRMSEKISKKMKENWKDPEFRGTMITGMKENWKDSEYREKKLNLSII